MWEYRCKNTGRSGPIDESALREQLQTDYRFVNSIIATMREHPGEWHYGRFWEYRYVNRETDNQRKQT